MVQAISLSIMLHFPIKIAMASFLFWLHISNYYTVVYLAIQHHWSMTVHAFLKRKKYNQRNKHRDAFDLHTYFRLTYMLSTYTDAFDLHTCFRLTYMLSTYTDAFDLHTCFRLTYMLSTYIHAFDLHRCFRLTYMLSTYTDAFDLHRCFRLT